MNTTQKNSSGDTRTTSRKVLLFLYVHIFYDMFLPIIFIKLLYGLEINKLLSHDWMTRNFISHLSVTEICDMIAVNMKF